MQVSHSYRFWEWWALFQYLSSQTLANGQPHKQMFLKNSQVCCVYSSAEIGRHLKGKNREGGCSWQRENICSHRNKKELNIFWKQFRLQNVRNVSEDLSVTWIPRVGVFCAFGRSRNSVKKNWNLIALRCCVRFHYTLKWISYVYTYIPSLLDSCPYSFKIIFLWHIILATIV